MIAYCQSRLAFPGRAALAYAGGFGAAAGAAGDAAGAAVGAAGAAVGAAGAAIGSVLDAALAWVVSTTVGLLRPQSMEMLTPIQDYQVTSSTADNL